MEGVAKAGLQRQENRHGGQHNHGAGGLANRAFVKTYRRGFGPDRPENHFSRATGVCGDLGQCFAGAVEDIFRRLSRKNRHALLPKRVTAHSDPVFREHSQRVGIGLRLA
jgi:hypothetical protein